MKKVIVFAAFVCLLIGCSNQPYTVLEKKPIEDMPYYGPKEYCRELTREQALEDLDYLAYVIENCYSGYDSMMSKGFSIEDFRTKQKDLIIQSGSQIISTGYLLDSCSDYLRPYINDAHISFAFDDFDLYYEFVKYKYVFFSDVYVKKEGDRYFYFDTSSGIDYENEYIGNKDMLFCYPAKGKDVYRVGLMSEALEDFNYDIEFSRGIMTPLFVQCRNWKSEKSDFDFYYSLLENSTYINISSFDTPAEDNIHRDEINRKLDAFVNLATRCRSKEYVIVDLRANSGGSSIYFNHFLTNLYGTNKCDCEADSDSGSSEDADPTYILNSLIYHVIAENFKEIDSKFIDKEMKYYIDAFNKLYKSNRGKRIVYIQKDTVLAIQSNEFTNSNTKLILLVGKKTASSAEAAVTRSRRLLKENCIVIGANTMGAVEYGDCIDLHLPNSGTLLHVPSNWLKSYKDIDGIGFRPDYWSSNADLYDTIYELTGEERLSLIRQYLY